jgi:glycosyltransferase 2 family protein
VRAALRTIVATVLAVGLIAVFLRNADLERVWGAMRGADPLWVLAAVALTLLTYIIRTERWQYLLEPLGPTRFWVAFRATVIGFAASSVLPARAGEVLRPYLLARREGLSATATFATIIVERVLDLVAVLLLLAAYLSLFDPGMAARDSALFAAVRIGGLLMAPVAVVALVVMYLLAGHASWLETLLSWVDRLLPARLAAMVGRLLRMFAEGFGVLRRPQRVLASLGWSLVLWLVIAAETWVVARAFDYRDAAGRRLADAGAAGRR